MTQRTITITLDIPDELAAAVGHEAYIAMTEVGASAQHRRNTAHDAARMLRASTDAPNHVGAVAEAVASLNAQARVIHEANAQVKLALSDIVKAMNTVDMEWRRRQ